MARKPTPSTEITTYDDELAELAGGAVALTSASGGGRFFSTRAGVLQFEDAPMPGNQMCAIVIGWCLENVYYEGDFDADNRAPPTCFAFCKDSLNKDMMGPDPEVLGKDPETFEIQNETCEGCAQNEWGSSRRGRGKACANRRRLALLPAGTYSPVGRGGGFDLDLIADEEHWKNGDVAYMKLPVTSGKGFDTYVKNIMEASSQRRSTPIFMAYTRIFITPDPKSQFKINFELIQLLGEDPKDAEEKKQIRALIDRHKKVMLDIDFPYVPFHNDEEEAKPATKAANKKLTSKGGARR